jgi:hypothetical protein
MRVKIKPSVDITDKNPIIGLHKYKHRSKKKARKLSRNLSIGYASRFMAIPRVFAHVRTTTATWK